MKLALCFRLHALLAQEPALRECCGEASGGALPFGGVPKVVQEAAAMKAALRNSFEVIHASHCTIRPLRFWPCGVCGNPDF